MKTSFDEARRSTRFNGSLVIYSLHVPPRTSSTRQQQQQPPPKVENSNEKLSVNTKTASAVREGNKQDVDSSYGSNV
jgi:hypothetical protein